MKKKTQLFLLHFAGGSCYSFSFMFPLLDDFSVIPLELPGRGNRINESFKKDLFSAAKDIYSQILNNLDGSDFIIYGHSLGATLALKVTHMLEQVNKIPAYLFVSGNEGPNTSNTKKRHLFKDESLVEELIKYGGVSPEVIENADFLDFFLPILRADFEIVEKNADFTFVINTPIYAMMGDTEEDVDKISNWKNFTKSTFKSQIFKGGHFFIHDYPKDIVNIITENYSNISSKIEDYK